jgi:hypothetical protein
MRKTNGQDLIALEKGRQGAVIVLGCQEHLPDPVSIDQHAQG